jgi:hypothetical protein
LDEEPLDGAHIVSHLFRVKVLGTPGQSSPGEAGVSGQLCSTSGDRALQVVQLCSGRTLSADAAEEFLKNVDDNSYREAFMMMALQVSGGVELRSGVVFYPFAL